MSRSIRASYSGYTTLPAALVHDWLYSGNVPCTREFADGVYRDGLITLGFPKWKANLEYYTLRLFGGSHWKENTP